MPQKVTPPRILASTPNTPSAHDWLAQLKVGASLETLDRYLDRRLTGVPTPWEAVNRTLLGLGGLVVIQGAPKTNKSTAALQIVVHNASIYGRPALVVDEENGRDCVRMRVLCQLTGQSEVGLQELKAFRPPLYESLRERLAALPISIASGVVQEPAQLEAFTDVLVSQAKDVAFLVIDSVQAMPRLLAEERSNLEFWMQQLDRLKLKYNGRLVIIATSEKNYASYDQATIRGGKGSSEIGYKAELVLDFREAGPSAVRMEVVANRHGFRGASWEMELQLADRKNPASFVYQLAPKGELPG